MVKIIGRLYDEVPVYYDFDDKHKWPYFTCIEEKSWILSNITDINEAEEWVAYNHPEYYMGCNIVNNKGDFLCTAVPCGGDAYETGTYETIEARIKYVQSIDFSKKLY